ncbi:MAG TPA: DegT/DnrJ/EryC1/StrS family aminotransferase [Chthoniobacteraceae bacterium]|nr:DegT/DnrJ/EryC1/StrS family aminotransferase [Chthoniobacteraceae bacterium]
MNQHPVTDSFQKRWGIPELERLTAMLDQPSLFYWKGPQTAALLERFRQHYPFKEVMPCSSGTAAIHIAVAAAGIGPGDEVIVPPITDMGTVIGILYQQGVPVFADLDPHTYNLDPDDVRRRITPRTRAIVVVHLAGNPCPMERFQALAREHGLVLIEDCAQAWGSRWRDQPVGSFGDFGCYSLNDFKHISCGDGGLVGSSVERFAGQLQKFGDKAYDRVSGSRTPDVLAPNYRISEPQSAVAAAQLERMPEIANRRHRLGTRLGRQLEGVPGIVPHRVEPEAYCTYWFYLLRLADANLRAEFVRRLQAEGVEGVGAGYLPMPLYRFPVFANHDFFGGRWPVRELGLTEMDYREVSCPVAEAITESAVRLTVHERMEEASIDFVADAIRRTVAALGG